MSYEIFQTMKSKFEMSIEGELSFFIGLQIKQINEGIFVCQSKFAKELMSKSGLKDSNPFNTPISTSDKITIYLTRVATDTKLYMNVIGSLLCLTSSRLDISFSVGACVMYQAFFRESHLKVAKIIKIYINETINYGLWYLFDTNNVIIGYSEVD